MKINGIPILDLKVLPENILIDCAAQFGPEEDNRFKICLQQGSLFKEAGLSPLYVCTDTMDAIFVTSKEKLKNLLH